MVAFTSKGGPHLLLRWISFVEYLVLGGDCGPHLLLVAFTSNVGFHLQWWPSPPMVALTSHGGPYTPLERGGDHSIRKPLKINCKGRGHQIHRQTDIVDTKLDWHMSRFITKNWNVSHETFSSKKMLFLWLVRWKQGISLGNLIWHISDCGQSQKIKSTNLHHTLKPLLRGKKDQLWPKSIL